MNIDILDLKISKTKTNRCEVYESKMAQLGFEQKITTITRQEYRNNVQSVSCIDHILCKTEKLNSIGMTILTKISDHYSTALFVWSKTNSVIKNKEEKPNTEPFYNHRMIIDKLQSVNWDCLKQFNDVNTMYQKIEGEVRQIYEECKIIKTNLKNKNTAYKKKWVSTETCNLIKVKNNLWKKIQSSKRCNQKFINDYKKAK